ncbi:hypothetical protein [Lyngbya confervoides]|uniref:Uncharacterized protein n=1 Tax=Lyngbya confervoides BDU141951 TaxID=1574623 RepID=A0ABD4T9Z3_9CYAN|nr:hypothetical protein [Lyngbya confervoides]MCM1985289.1 hypothetical protein [Lyngbya confervoides BDU141951]
MRPILSLANPRSFWVVITALGLSLGGLSSTAVAGEEQIDTPRTLASPTSMLLAQEPALPEEVATDLVNQLSDQLATKLNSSSCADFNTLLDNAQADSANPNRDTDSIESQVLNDVKANPKLRAIVITKLGEPLLGKILDCNLIPLGALTD